MYLRFTGPRARHASSHSTESYIAPFSVWGECPFGWFTASCGRFRLTYSGHLNLSATRDYRRITYFPSIDLRPMTASEFYARTVVLRFWRCIRGSWLLLLKQNTIFKIFSSTFSIMVCSRAPLSKNTHLGRGCGERRGRGGERNAWCH